MLGSSICGVCFCFYVCVLNVCYCCGVVVALLLWLLLLSVLRVYVCVLGYKCARGVGLVVCC